MYLRYMDPIGYARRLGVVIGKDCRLISVDFGTEPFLVTLGDHVSITMAHFITHDGGLWVFRERSPEVDVIAPIRVGNNVFIGFGAIILPGVTIGDNVVIGAGAVVARDIPSNCVAVGVPARPVKSIDEYWSSLDAKGLLRTKQMKPEEKRSYLVNHFGSRSERSERNG